MVLEEQIGEEALCRGDPPGVRVHAHLCRRLEVSAMTCLPLSCLWAALTPVSPPEISPGSVLPPKTLGTSHRRHCTPPSQRPLS